MQLRQVEADLRAKALIFHAPIDWVSVLRAAEVIAEAHNLAIGCRSADLFHVAAAMVAKADEFLTFDERQKKLARAVGLPVGP
jgi:predicted nucleic acid-binding protein